jgi:hypothetical protein
VDDGGILGVGEDAEAALGRQHSWSCCQCSPPRRCSASATAEPRSASCPIKRS